MDKSHKKRTKREPRVTSQIFFSYFFSFCLVVYLKRLKNSNSTKMSLIFIILNIAFWCGLTGRSQKLLFHISSSCVFFFFHHQEQHTKKYYRAMEKEKRQNRREQTSAFCICKVEKNHRGVSEGSLFLEDNFLCC